MCIVIILYGRKESHLLKYLRYNLSVLQKTLAFLREFLRAVLKPRESDIFPELIVSDALFYICAFR